jgi:predicted helicase
MSEFSIKQYQNEVEKIIHFGGTKKETAIRTAFYNLLNEYAKQKGLMIVTEIEIKATNSNRKVTPDGTLKDVLRQDWGYWESKDESDDLNEEIKKKFDKGYPKENILFEDSQTAVLIQNGSEELRVSMKDADALHRIISAFINFERPEVRYFRKAIELFKQDIPKVTETLRGIIIAQEKTNSKFIKASETFLKLCHDSINQNITNEDVREMIIQHILTEDVFNTIFDENQFHRENNIARELESVINTFFTGNIRKIALGAVQHYYQAINAAAAGIADHHEKQKFLKVIYETFYKSYNPKAADRLGVVYTPNEIVQFMIKSTDYLLNKHFNKFLEDKNVEILDPATGTGTFICDMIDYMSKDKLAWKYKNEMHANEVAILPYYISNLNIEFTYTQKMGSYSEFENLCFVDTLDNMGFAYRGKQIDLFSPFTEENSKRIKKQNDKKIAVVIGNPPYNANQANENENNKNREYREIDKRIKETFIKYSTAQKSKVYDMYARFYRWAMDRIDNKGIITYITNNSFINSRTFDGFRKSIQTEFQYVYIIDLGGNIRELSGKDGIFLNENHTIFGQAAAVGIAIMFLVKNTSIKDEMCNIYYIHPTDMRATREEKLAFLADHKFSEIPFEHINPDKNNNWINLSQNDFETFIPLLSKNNIAKSIFELSTNGVSTNRDEWVYEYSRDKLKSKIDFFMQEYNSEVKRWEEFKISNNYKDIKAEANPVLDNLLSERNLIKWSKMIKRDKLRKGKRGEIKIEDFRKSLYRPFSTREFYFGYIPIDMRGAFDSILPVENSINYVIALNSANSKDFQVICTKYIADLHFLGDSKCVSLYRYDALGNQIDNISDWGLNKFTKQYGKKGVNKETVFQYIYAVLHNPAYRVKYQLNLRREFPRIPFYEDFKQWTAWGQTLMALHINFETVEPFNLKEISTDHKENPKTKLKTKKESGAIVLDENTTLTGIPKEAWAYKLGNRSALEWILDQYKESKPKDPTIAEKFNTYKFSDYKTQVIDLLKRVCTVSVETMKIIEQMANP